MPLKQSTAKFLGTESRTVFERLQEGSEVLFWGVQGFSLGNGKSSMVGWC